MSEILANTLQTRLPVVPTSECLNGGFADKNGCTCPPGFKGNKCEHGE